MKEESLSAPSAWRASQQSRAHVDRNGIPARLGRGVARASRELANHPVETIAMLAMAVAMARLAARRESPLEIKSRPSRNRRRIVPIALMAAICTMMLAGCG